MKVISYETGRLVQLIHMDEVRPLSGVYLPGAFEEIARRYEFVTKPINVPEAVKSGAKFEHGHITINGNNLLVQNLDIYNDGVVVAAPSTDEADLIADEFITWVTQALSLRERMTMIPRVYSSMIVVDFEKPIESFTEKFDAISAILSHSLKHQYNWDYKVDLSRLWFSVDPTTIPSLRNTQFAIERRQGVPHSTNRFFCTAPLPTKEHLRVLEALEAILSTN